MDALRVTPQSRVVSMQRKNNDKCLAIDADAKEENQTEKKFKQQLSITSEQVHSKLRTSSILPHHFFKKRSYSINTYVRPSVRPSVRPPVCLSAVMFRGCRHPCLRIFVCVFMTFLG